MKEIIKELFSISKPIAACILCMALVVGIFVGINYLFYDPTDPVGAVAPEPTIEIRTFDSEIGKTLEIKYRHHNQRGWCYVRFTSKKEIESYRLQVKSLLEAIDEYEKIVPIDQLDRKSWLKEQENQ